jgi:hypothetical protein
MRLVFNLREQVGPWVGLTGGWCDDAGRHEHARRCYEVISFCNLLHEYHDIRWRTIRMITGFRCIDRSIEP